MTRPVESLTKEELHHFMRTNKPFRRAWRMVGPLVRLRDRRGAKMYTMAYGWLYCLAFHRDLFERLFKEFYEGQEERVGRLRAEFVKRTGIEILE